MKYIIRKSTIEDMKSVMDAHRRSIVDICSEDYTPEQIKNYSNVKYSSEIWKKSINEEYHISVEVNGVVEGFCHARMRKDGNGEILGLYFSKTIAGKGIGKEVVSLAFSYLDKFKPPKIVLTGTVTAKPFYEKMGFVEVEKKIADLRGTKIQCFKMEKVLNIP